MLSQTPFSFFSPLCYFLWGIQLNPHSASFMSLKNKLLSIDNHLLVFFFFFLIVHPFSPQDFTIKSSQFQQNISLNVSLVNLVFIPTICPLNSHHLST